MGSFDGAEICKIIELYLLNKLSNLLDKENVGLYRDDGLAAINSCSGPVLDRTRKNIIALLKKEGLNIIIETNLVDTDFLDVTFNLVTEKYLPYRKPNSNPLYINAKSNHQTNRKVHNCEGRSTVSSEQAYRIYFQMSPSK